MHPFLSLLERASMLNSCLVCHSLCGRDGAFIDYLGHYNPRTDPPTISIDQEKVEKWISVGAQPTDSVKQLLYTLSKSEKAESE